MATIIPWDGKWPQIAADAFIAPNATIIGDVVIGSGSSVWFNCVLRADVNIMRIGARTNIQDGSIIHVDSGGFPTIIGDDVLIGHKAMIHGSRLENGSFVGMCATLLDGVHVESEGMVAAGAFVTQGKRIGRRQLWGGWPAKLMREIRDEEVEGIKRGVSGYAARAQEMRRVLSEMEL
jgi:carbonic anhydrase/acetyltransferase-like protein (isoleucine patch superfamily)